MLADDPATGRIELLASPQRMVDTRCGDCPPHTTSRILEPGYINLTVLGATNEGAAAIHPCGEAPHDGSMWLPFAAGEMSSVRYATSDSLCLTSEEPIHVIADRYGLVSPTPQTGLLQYVPLAEPVTLFDSDNVIGNFGPLRAVWADRPAGNFAAVIAVGAWALDAFTLVHLFGCESSAGGPADLVAPSALQELVASPLLDDVGNFCISSSGRASVYVDQLGVLAAGGPDVTALPPAIYNVRELIPEPRLVPMSPTRVVDTRHDLGAPGPMTPLDAAFIGAGVATPSTTALSLNITSTRQRGDGYSTIWPCGYEMPETSNLNFVPGVDRANAAIGTLGFSWWELQNDEDDPDDPGETCVWSFVETDLVVDVTGRYEWGGGLGAEPISPRRLLDTRNAIGIGTRTAVPANSVVVVQATGHGGVPATAVGAVSVNVTATEPQQHGYLTVWPCDEPRPEASTLNYSRGATVPNLTNAKLSASGTFCIYTSAATHVLADVGAWYGPSASSGLVELPPDRLLDTRNNIGWPYGAIGSHSVLPLQVTGRGGVREDATAVVLNVTAVGPQRTGYATVWPCDENRPEVSNLNFGHGDIVANLVTVKLDFRGAVCFFSDTQTHLLADVAGFLTAKPFESYHVVME